MRRRSLIVGAAALPFASAAKADAFPNGPFRIIVPFGPGSATDQSARNVAEGLNRAFGVPAVVENKPGPTARLPPTSQPRPSPMDRPSSSAPTPPRPPTSR